jgi:lipoate-protein ligase A
VVTQYPLSTWRLIRSGADDGATNMATDEAIVHAVASGSVPATLRLYAWAPPCLSLGRGQPVGDVNREAVKAAGYDLVRRPTGGRAILHVDELTYSLVVPQDEPRVVGGVVESYRRLSAGLVGALNRLGVASIVADERAEDGGPQGPVCFEIPSDYEITVSGKKLVGSAQMRSHGVVLQHGALPLSGDIARICPLLASHPEAGRVRARASTLEEALGSAPSWDEAADALATGFGQALDLTLEPSSLTAAERAQTQVLRSQKYATDQWTTLL